MKKINLTYIGVISLILFASFTRLIPHMPNFTPIGAMALFGGAYLSNKYHAFFIPILSLWLSDLIINNFILNYYDQFTWFYPGFIWQYASFGIIILLGYFLLKKIGIEWCIQQSKELKKHGVPFLHYYSMGKALNIKKIAKEVF